MGERAYIALITLWVTFGLALTTVGVAATYGSKLTWGWAIGCFITTLGGIVWVSLTRASQNIILTIPGYCLIAFPFGALLGPLCATHQAHLLHVVGTTLILSIGLGGIGVLIPKSLKSWGGYLFGGLLALIIAQFSLTWMTSFGLPVLGAFSILDNVGILLFAAYIVYDMNQALQQDRTGYNALDVAVNMYLNVLNLFVRLLNRD